MQLSPELFSVILGQSSHFVGLSIPVSQRLVWINNAGLHLFEIDQEEIDKGLSLRELFRKVPAEFDSYCTDQSAINSDAFTGLFEFRSRKNSSFSALFTCEPFEYGTEIYLLINIMDVRDLSVLKSEADKEKERFKVLFENATVGMLVADKEGVIVTVNPFAERQFGYQRGELIGKQVETLIPDHLKKRHKTLRSNFVEVPQHRPMGIGLDLYGKKKDGSTFPVEISLSHYEFNKEVYVIAFINDITIRKEAEETVVRQKQAAEKYSEEVRRLNEALERRVEERTTVLRETLNQLELSKEELEAALEKEKELSDLKSRFVSMASHEFRTPLSTILSSASLIERYHSDEDQEKRMRHIQRIKENVKNLNDILEDFLSLGKLEEGLIKAKLEPLNIQEFISSIIHDMNEVKKHGQILNHVHTGGKIFSSDKHLLKNILINLISNAIKFSSENGKVDVNSAIKDDTLKVRVRDHGIGISEEDREHLFDRFFRGKNALNIKGTGLGLHIVSKYLELLNGTIECQSRLNEGTEFTIILERNND